VIILGRNITMTKWRSLILLVIGCVLVASPAFNRPIDCDEETIVSKTKDIISETEGGIGLYETTLGVCAVLVMVTISGYSAIYFEGMLKKAGEKITIWERNFQLALYSTVLLVLIVVYDEAMSGASLYTYVFFKGWTINTVLIALIQAAGGLLVAATLKYADAVLKTLATSGSIVLSALLGFLLLGGSLDIFVSLGCLATILAIFNYTLDSTPPAQVVAAATAATLLEESK
jgi:UDP-sugar transporter A1/2/3